MTILKEACVGSYAEAVRASELGADRIELCQQLLIGGTTPTAETITLAGQIPDVDVQVIIRPRGDDFCYSDAEFGLMKVQIETVKQIGGSGVVLGILTEAGLVDIVRTKELVQLASPLPVTFHMAFDEIVDKKAAIDVLCEIGIVRILTKGGSGSALENLAVLKELVTYAADRLVIMPGGGITAENCAMVAELTGAVQLHGTKIVGDLS